VCALWRVLAFLCVAVLAAILRIPSPTQQIEQALRINTERINQQPRTDAHYVCRVIIHTQLLRVPFRIGVRFWRDHCSAAGIACQ
jgi:hypothetical protein